MVHLPIYMHHRKQPNEGKYIPCMDGNGCSLQSFTCSEQTANLPWSSNLARQILPRSPRKSGSWNLNDVSTSVYWGLKPWNKGRLGSSLSNVFQTNTLVWCQHHGARERERERERCQDHGCCRVVWVSILVGNMMSWYLVVGNICCFHPEN